MAGCTCDDPEVWYQRKWRHMSADILYLALHVNQGQTSGQLCALIRYGSYTFFNVAANEMPSKLAIMRQILCPCRHFRA